MLKKFQTKKLIKSIRNELKSLVHQLKYDLTHKKFKPATVFANSPRRHK